MLNTRVAIDHVGVSVPDLSQAVEFFVDVFGCELVYEAGPYPNVGYFWPGESAPEPATVRLAVLNHNDTHNIELLEYTEKPRNGNDVAPRPSDRGGSHLAFHVEDITVAVEQLKQRSDVAFLGEVDREQGGPIDGLDWVYLQTSWGLIIELLSYRPGLPYEATTTARMVPPPWS